LVLGAHALSKKAELAGLVATFVAAAAVLDILVGVLQAHKQQSTAWVSTGSYVAALSATDLARYQALPAA